jgi:hypothetical protein
MPEPRPLLDQLAAGDLDAHLVAIAEAVAARLQLLRTVTAQEALAMLNVGDPVRVNHHATLRYLHGVLGVVVELDIDWRPAGRDKLVDWPLLAHDAATVDAIFPHGTFGLRRSLKTRPCADRDHASERRDADMPASLRSRPPFTRGSSRDRPAWLLVSGLAAVRVG